MEDFMDRVEAGRLLGQRLDALRVVDPVVLALPRGGVPVAAEVARALHAPLDLLMGKRSIVLIFPLSTADRPCADAGCVPHG